MLQQYGIKEKQFRFHMVRVLLKPKATKNQIQWRDVKPNRSYVRCAEGFNTGKSAVFDIYHDIQKTISHITTFLFGDDALLYVIGNSVAECTEKINIDLKNLVTRFKMNKMVLLLNVNKTKCMCINDTLNDVVHITD